MTSSIAAATEAMATRRRFPRQAQPESFVQFMREGLAKGSTKLKAYYCSFPK